MFFSPKLPKLCKNICNMFLHRFLKPWRSPPCSSLFMTNLCEIGVRTTPLSGVLPLSVTKLLFLKFPDHIQYVLEEDAIKHYFFRSNGYITFETRRFRKQGNMQWIKGYLTLSQHRAFLPLKYGGLFCLQELIICYACVGHSYP